MESTKPSPTSQADRILSLDVLRGFAVLGILIMNIQSFSMIGPAEWIWRTLTYFRIQPFRRKSL